MFPHGSVRELAAFPSFWKSLSVFRFYVIFSSAAVALDIFSFAIPIFSLRWCLQFYHMLLPSVVLCQIFDISYLYRTGASTSITVAASSLTRKILDGMPGAWRKFAGECVLTLFLEASYFIRFLVKKSDFEIVSLKNMLNTLCKQPVYDVFCFSVFFEEHHILFVSAPRRVTFRYFV